MTNDPWKESAARMRANNPWTAEDEARIQAKRDAEAAMYAAQNDEPCEAEDDEENEE